MGDENTQPEAPKPTHIGGRFAAGNKCAKGHKKPHVNDVKRIRAMLFESSTEDDWNKVKAALFNKAMSGDVKAMNLLFSYVLGKPVQAIDVNMTACQISPEEATARIKAFFNLE